MSNSRGTKPSRERTSLWDGEHGTTCPVFPFYRHPMFRRLKPICYGWMPFFVVAALVFGRFEFAAWLIGFYLLFFLGVVGLLVLINQHGKLNGVARSGLRLVKGWRFLCPACLQFGPERYACGNCGAEVEEFLLLTHGLYLNDCPSCHAPIFRGDQHSAQARCLHCQARCEVPHHQRRVRVFGVLDPGSLRALAHWPLLTHQAGGTVCLQADDGTLLTYVINVGDPALAPGPFGPSHAVRALEALWIERIGEDPLRLAQALDRFIRQARLTAEERAVLPIWVKEQDGSAASRNVLEARFPHVRYGVGGDAILTRSGAKRAAATRASLEAR